MAFRIDASALPLSQSIAQTLIRPAPVRLGLLVFLISRW
jgi:hypothetical protein